jgi:hypothetical protein
MPSARYPWNPFEIKARAQYKRRSAVGTVQRVGVAWAFSRQESVFLPLEKCPIVTAAHAFRGDATPKIPYIRLNARRRDLYNGRYAWIVIRKYARA